MGHHIAYATMPLTATQAEMDDWRTEEILANHDRMEGEPCVEPVRRLDDKVIDGMEAARERLEAYAMTDGIGYRDGAVEFRDASATGDVPKSSKLRTLEERMTYLVGMRAKTHDEALPSKRKGKRVTCTKCESSLANAYLGDRDTCPVCGNGLLAQSTIQRLDKLDERIRRCEAELREENEKLSRKAPTMWLVRASCHC